MKKIMLIFSVVCTTSTFSQTTPNFQDWVTSLAIDSTGAMYAGTSSNGSGIYISADSGATWRQTPMKYGVNTMAISRAGTILAFAFGQSYGRYLFRLSAKGTVLDSVSLSFTPSSIIALRGGSVKATAFGGGIYNSIDDGKNWSLYGTNPFPGTDVVALAMIDSGTILAASKDRMLRSSNAGVTWGKCSWGGHDSISIIAFSAPPGRTVYAGLYEGFNVNAYEIFRSTDGGANWTVLTKLKNPINVMAVDSAGTIFAGSLAGVCRIGASGDTASIGPAGIAHSGYGIRTILALRRDTVYAGAWGGVYKTTNKGLSWAVLNNGLLTPIDSSKFTNSLPGGNIISCGLIDQNGTMLVGTDSAGIFRSVDKGRTWMQTSLTLPFVTHIVQDTVGSYYASTAKNSVYSSQDGGVSWSKVPDQLGLASNRRFNCLAVGYNVIPYLTDPTKYLLFRILFAGTDAGVYSNILGIMSASWMSTWIMNGYYTAICPVALHKMLGFASDGTITQRTVDDVSWTYRATVKQSVTSAVKISDTLLFAVGSRGVYRSNDTGLTWIQKISGIIDTSLISAAVSSNGILFVGSAKGSIYRSTDRGEQWTLVAKLSYPVRCILPDEMNIFATTGDKFFRSSITEVRSLFTQPTVPGRFILCQNYPNPFNPTTTISYQLPTSAFVTLKVFDVLGREVAVLVNEEKDAGAYSVVWDASRISTGIYFYTLHVGDFAQTKRMVLIK